MDLCQYKNQERFFGRPFLAGQLFCGLSRKTSQALSEIKHPVLFNKSQIIYGIRDLPNNIYILRKGKARLFIATEQKPHCAVRDILINEVIGLPESLAYFQYETGIEAATTCICDSIERKDLIGLLEGNSELCYRLLGVLGDNLNKSYKAFSSHEF